MAKLRYSLNNRGSILLDGIIAGAIIATLLLGLASTFFAFSLMLRQNTELKKTFMQTSVIDKAYTVDWTELEGREGVQYQIEDTEYGTKRLIVIINKKEFRIEKR